MYDFILNMWALRRFDSIKVQNCVTKLYIIQTQANTILTTPQVA